MSLIMSAYTKKKKHFRRFSFYFQASTKNLYSTFMMWLWRWDAIWICIQTNAIAANMYIPSIFFFSLLFLQKHISCFISIYIIFSCIHLLLLLISISIVLNWTETQAHSFFRSFDHSTKWTGLVGVLSVYHLFCFGLFRAALNASLLPKWYYMHLCICF